MTRKNIKVLVVNRAIYPDEKDYGGLNSHINALMAYGYSVTEEKLPPRDMASYDIIVAHPPLGFITKLVNFHKSHPEIPLILDSMYRKGDRPSKYEGYGKDADGVYYCTWATMQDFLRLVKGLTSEMYRSRALSE
jgi:hypothetical protein